MWHDGLIYKLILFKFPTYLIKIIHSYLDNRTFNVKLNDVLSSQRPILASTPQGSILSPALYNIYTSDFPTDNNRFGRLATIEYGRVFFTLRTFDDMSILEKLAMMPNMDVDTSDEEMQSPYFRRLEINRKIETDMMLLKTYQELNAKYHTSDPSLVKTTNTAAADRQVNLNALVSERDSLPECLTFNCQFCPKNNPTTPVNAENVKIFDLKTLGYLQVRVEGFLVRGITQCFNCNNFFHTASECHLKPRCLKCGNEHPTKQCPIKERQDNPFCINCQEYGHTACYTKCPQFPKPKKGSPLPKIQNLNKNKCKEGVTFANVVSGTNFPPLPTPNATVTKPSEIKNSSKEIHGIQQEDKSDLAQKIELVNLISNILKRSPEILQILNNLKNADDDNAKTFLLVEALLDKK
ncbi:uncharacterized protein TNCV_4817521 [Trichonephila clavipes]|nr:uncharacterized protein TNCV_4817521 [Trichonephila clavipes]